MRTAQLLPNELKYRTLTCPPPLTHVRRNDAASVDFGLSEGSSLRTPVSEDPHRHERKFGN